MPSRPPRAILGAPRQPTRKAARLARARRRGDGDQLRRELRRRLLQEGHRGRALPLLDRGRRSRHLRRHPRHRARDRPRATRPPGVAPAADRLAPGARPRARDAARRRGRHLTRRPAPSRRPGAGRRSAALAGRAHGGIRRQLDRRRLRRALCRGDDLPRARLLDARRALGRRGCDLRLRGSPSPSATGSCRRCPSSRSSAVALAWLRMRVDSVFPGMLVHCAFNSFALASVFF